MACKRLSPSLLLVLLCACAAEPTEPADSLATLEGRTGRMMVTDYKGAAHEISYVVRHGHAIYQDHIDLGPVDAAMLNGRGLVWRSLSKRWPDNTVYYDYSVTPAGCDPATAGTSYPACLCTNYVDTTSCWDLGGDEVSGGDRKKVRDALDEIERLTDLRFVRGQVAGKPYFTFAKNDFGSGAAHPDAYNLNSGFTVQITFAGFDNRTVLHEVGHALGFIHEQNRADTTVTFAPICMVEPAVWETFDTVSREYLTPFDIDSVMMYPSFGAPSVTPTCTSTSSTDCCPVYYKPGGSHVYTYTVPTGVTSPISFRGTDYYYTAGQTLTFTGDGYERTPGFSAEDLNALHQMYPPALGSAEPGDRFGAEMVGGDFNGDGYRDLAVSAPKEGPNGGQAGGAVFVYRGTYTGLQPWQMLEMDSTLTDDMFGWAMASGDLNHDGVDDLVVSARDKQNGSKRPGALYVYVGGNSGDARAGLVAYDHFLPSELGIAEGTDDDFGYALDIAHVMDVTGVTDAQQVLVGAPGSNSSAGKGYVLRWSDTQATYHGTGTGTLVLHATLAHSTLAGGNYGKAIRAGQLDSDGYDDIVASATGGSSYSGTLLIYKGGTLQNCLKYGVGGTATHFGASIRFGHFHSTGGDNDIAVGEPDSASGKVYILDPTITSSAYCTASIVQTLEQNNNGSNADRFGATLGTGDFDGDNITDLAVGSGQDDRDSMTDVGSVWLFRGAEWSTSSWPRTKITSHSPWGTQASNDNFGAAIVIGNFDNQGPRDIAIGVPGQFGDTGALIVMHGAASSVPAIATTQHDFTTYLKEDSQSDVQK